MQHWEYKMRTQFKELSPILQLTYFAEHRTVTMHGRKTLHCNITDHKLETHFYMFILTQTENISAKTSQSTYEIRQTFTCTTKNAQNIKLTTQTDRHKQHKSIQTQKLKNVATNIFTSTTHNLQHISQLLTVCSAKDNIRESQPINCKRHTQTYWT